jgi:DNA invertase Pin-like site-specific DNA recombinase
MRVSNDDQQSENQLIALQQEVACRDLKVVKEYRLDGFSAWKGEHVEQLESMLKDAEAGIFANLVVWALDRLSRQGELPLLTILDRLNKAGVKVISVQERWTESPSDFRAILASFAGYAARVDSERRSERVKAGQRRAAATDAWPYGPTPYGYRRGVDARLALDENEANVVRKIFGLADAERLGAREIQKRLIGTVPTTRGGAVWAISVIDRMLRDTTYCGRHRTGITAPPIIAQAQFDRVQARLLSNRSLKPRTGNYWPLQGRMRCHCGQSWTFDAARPGKDKVDTCFCRGRTTTSRRVVLGGPRCSIPRQSEREVVKRLWLHLYESLGDRNHMLAALNASIRDIRAYVEEHSHDVAPMRAELDRTNEKLKRIARERINGVLADEEIDASEAEARSQKGALEKKLADLDPRRVETLEKAQRQLERAVWLKETVEAGKHSGGAAHFGIYGPDLLTCGSDLHDLQGRWRRNLGRVLDRLHAQVIVFPDHMEVRGLLSFTVPLGDQWPPENWKCDSRAGDGPVPPLHAFHAPEGQGEG